MLLTSHRHTRDDLEWWRIAEAADHEHGLAMLRTDQLQRAVDEMDAFAAAGACYAAVSWGKDSVVIAHLSTCMRRPVPVVNIVQQGPQHDPEVFQVRDAFLADHKIDYREIVVAADDSAQTDSQRASSLVTGIKIAQRQFGTTRYIGGVRAAESGTRKIRARVGYSGTCQPLSWWSDQDVFGYLKIFDLPVHPAYAMVGGGRYSRGRIRVSIIAGAKGRQFGRDEWEREYYGDVLRRMESSRFGKGPAR